VPFTLVRDVAEMAAGERVVVSGPGTIGLLTAAVAAFDDAEEVLVLGTEEDTAVRLPKAEAMGATETMVFGDEALAAIDADPPSVWFETSGAPPAIEAAVDHVAGNGRVVVSGLGDGPWDVDMRRVAYENLSILGQWGGNDKYVEPAADAMLSGDIDVAEIITDVVPLTEWRDGFDRARTQAGIKVLIDPSA
jgi:threonine dehydrogenase-like Zn-dependent dehydrogenase